MYLYTELFGLDFLSLPGGRKKEGQPCDAQKYNRRQERLKIFFSLGKIFIVHCKKGKRFSRPKPVCHLYQTLPGGV
jgi:hypothetical protein